MENLELIIAAVGDFVWGPVMIILLVGTGLFLTIRLKMIQFRGFRHAWALVLGKHDNPEDQGEISHFQALSAALAATIGTGNIAGVATAIAAGGPGAVFWMWITAVVGMATKYASCTLGVKFRKVADDGVVSGGPMYYIQYGLGWKWLAVLFAMFTAIASFGIGNMVQSNSVAQPLEDLLGIPSYVSGIIMAILVGLVIIGGIKRIGIVVASIVPFMAAVYVIGAMVIILYNYTSIIPSLQLIVVDAFTPSAAAGGFAGAVVMETIRYGVARGIFSNEAGLGSAPIAHAAARTNEPVREGLVASLGPFIDTLVVCTMTALVIVMSGAWTDVDSAGTQLTGATLSATAFASGLPGFGQYIVTFGVIFFAFSTIIGWSYYGDRSIEYLFGRGAIKYYHFLWVILIPLGATMQLEMVWNLSDAANGLMILPNLIALLALSGIVAKETKSYFARQKQKS